VYLTPLGYVLIVYALELPNKTTQIALRHKVYAIGLLSGYFTNLLYNNTTQLL